MRVLVLYAVLCVLYVRSLTDRACVREEGDVRQALAELYDSAGGERWVSSDGWSGNRRTQSCCTWYGVHCAAGINHSGIVEVLSVRMVANGLRGDFSAILSVLERFCSLETLDLSSNRISGTIPHSVVRMARLQTLRLEENLIAGVIPDEIAGLSRLRELILARNSLDGTLPRSLGVMKSLRHVNLGSNTFVGELPSQWAGLRWWRRADDADGHAMEFFSVAYNQLVGLVPAFLVDIPLQTVVELHGNRFICATALVHALQMPNSLVLHTHGCVGLKIDDWSPRSIPNSMAAAVRIHASPKEILLFSKSAAMLVPYSDMLSCVFTDSSGRYVFDAPVGLISASASASLSVSAAPLGANVATLSCPMDSRMQIRGPTALVHVVVNRTGHVLASVPLSVHASVASMGLPSAGPADGGTRIQVLVDGCVSRLDRAACAFTRASAAVDERGDGGDPLDPFSFAPFATRGAVDLSLFVQGSAYAGADLPTGAYCAKRLRVLECEAPAAPAQSSEAHVWVSLNGVDFFRAERGASFAYYALNRTVAAAYSAAACDTVGARHDGPSGVGDGVSDGTVGSSERGGHGPETVVMFRPGGAFVHAGTVLVCRVLLADGTDVAFGEAHHTQDTSGDSVVSCPVRSAVTTASAWAAALSLDGGQHFSPPMPLRCVTTETVPLRWSAFAIMCVGTFVLALTVVLMWVAAKYLPRVRQACSSRLGGARSRDWSVRVSYGRVKLSDLYAIEDDTETEMRER